MSWKIRDKLQKTLSSEQGTQVYAPGSRNPFALVYPNTYMVGMSNLGYQIIYQQINSRGDTACERAFLPDKKMLPEYVRTNTPLLTIETQRPLYEFSIIGFAVSFEMDYFNILKILDMGKIPLLAADRTEMHPLVIMGGPCATFNPEPLADFIDAFVIGEGEEVIHEILDTYYHCQAQEMPRRELLAKLALVDGVYVPRFYQPIYNCDGTIKEYERRAGVPGKVNRRWLKDLDACFGQTVIVTDDTEFKDMYLIEIARGCGRHCRFCMAGYCFRRPRVRSLESLTEALSVGRKYRDKVGLVGAAISDYPEIDELCEIIMKQGLKMSVASLRADSLTSKLVEALAASGHKTITLAPEAASGRMRKVINKSITDEHLYQAVTMTVKAGIPNVRLYIMIGLPTETEAETGEIIAMTRRLKNHMVKLGSNGKLTLSVNPFVPKPFTPFQWEPMADYDYVERELRCLQSTFKADKGIEVLIESPKEAYIQSVLARGDRKLGEILLTAHRLGGVKAWRQAIKETGCDEGFYLYRRRELQELLPWSNLDMGLESSYLEGELAAASEERMTPPCAEGCTRCGVCL